MQRKYKVKPFMGGKYYAVSYEQLKDGNVREYLHLDGTWNRFAGDNAKFSSEQHVKDVLNGVSNKMDYNVKAWPVGSSFNGVYATYAEKYLRLDGKWHVEAGSEAVFDDLNHIKRVLGERKQTLMNNIVSLAFKVREDEAKIMKLSEELEQCE